MTVGTTFSHLKQIALADYDDLVWKLAEEENAVADPHECGTICWTAEKSIEQLQQDVVAIRRRIELQPEINESVAASADRERVLESRRKAEADFDIVRRQHEERLSSISKELHAVDERLKGTTKAREHYRRSAPEWLRNRLVAVNTRLLDIHKRLNASPPRSPGDLHNGIIRLESVSDEVRSELVADHQASVDRHASALARFNANREHMLLEQDELKRERANLYRVEKLLRPTREDL